MLMTSTALLTLYRSLTRHKLHAILSIGGLALGVAVFLVLYLFVQNERGYDRHLPGSENVYVMATTYRLPGIPETPFLETMGNLIDQMKADFSGLEGARYKIKGVAVRQGDLATGEDIAVIDPEYFDLFPWPAAEGDPKTAILDPDTIVITRRMADKYFAARPAMGAEMTLVIDNEPYNFRIGAILEDLPLNTTFDSQIFVPFVPERYADENFDNWGSQTLNTFLRLPNRAAAADLAAKLPAFIDRRSLADQGPGMSDYMSMTPLPLHDVNLMSDADRTVVTTLGLVGLLTLLVAIVNYVNLATARAGLRAREVAVRKVVGGTRQSLIRQFVAESVTTVAVAALIGLALAELALPFVNSLGGSELAISYWGPESILPPLVLMVLVVGLLAGLYPAFILSGFRPAAVLASARAPGGGRAGQRLRRALVVLQFSIAIAFMIGTVVLFAQTAHLKQADLGFQRQGMALVQSFVELGREDPRRNELLAALRAIDGVTAVTQSGDAPGSTWQTNSTSMSRPGATGPQPSLTWVSTGPDYFSTYGARIIAGRDFGDDFALDDTANVEWEDMKKATYNVIISRTGARDLGFPTPEAAIGQIIRVADEVDHRVVGVVDDMRFRSPREALRPMLYYYQSSNIGGPMAALRFQDRDPQAVLADMEAAWKSIAPEIPFQGKTVDQNLYDAFYKQDADRSRLFTIGAVLAVVIGCIGLYGLASFDTARRVKEIGIRKTLGASTREIMQLLIGQFLRPVLLANLIAWPLAWLAMSKWLNGFDDRVALSPLFFIGATLLALVIAAVTIFGQTWRVARAEPARALRYE